MKKQQPDPELITDEFLITRRFRTSDAFSIYIETTASKKHITCLECLIEYCQEEDIDVESAAVLINQSLKDKIQSEAEKLHLLRTSKSGQLPI